MRSFRELRTLPRSLWFLCIAILVNRAGTMALPMLMLWLTTHRGYSPTEAADVFVILGFAQIAGTLSSGLFCDRFGAKPVLLTALVGFALVLVAMPLHTTRLSMCIGIALCGLFGDGFRPASYAAIGLLAPPEKRQLAFAFARTAINLGMSIGPLTGAFLVGWRPDWIFHVNALLAAAAAVLFLRIQIPREAKPPPVDGAPRRARFDPRLWLVLASSFCVATVFFQMDSTLQLFVTRDLDLDVKWVGFTITANTILIVFTEIPLNHHTAHWTIRRTLMLSTFLIACGFGAYALATGPATLLLATLVWTVGEMMCFPAQSAFIASIAPPGRAGRTMSLYVLVFGLAFPFGAGVGPRMYERYGATAVWLGCLAIGLLASTFVSRLRTEPTRAS